MWPKHAGFRCCHTWKKSKQHAYSPRLLDISKAVQIVWDIQLNKLLYSIKTAQLVFRACRHIITSMQTSSTTKWRTNLWPCTELSMFSHAHAPILLASWAPVVLASPFKSILCTCELDVCGVSVNVFIQQWANGILRIHAFLSGWVLSSKTYSAEEWSSCSVWLCWWWHWVYFTLPQSTNPWASQRTP